MVAPQVGPRRPRNKFSVCVRFVVFRVVRGARHSAHFASAFFVWMWRWCVCIVAVHQAHSQQVIARNAVEAANLKLIDCTFFTFCNEEQSESVCILVDF